MKVRHKTNLTRSHLTIFFIINKSQILIKVKSVNSKNVELLYLIRNGGSIIISYSKSYYGPPGFLPIQGLFTLNILVFFIALILILFLLILYFDCSIC